MWRKAATIGKAMLHVLDGGYWNVNQTTVITSILLVAFVTCHRNKERKNTTAKHAASRAGKLPLCPREMTQSWGICKPVFGLRKQVFCVVVPLCWMIACQRLEGGRAFTHIPENEGGTFLRNVGNKLAKHIYCVLLIHDGLSMKEWNDKLIMMFGRQSPWICKNNT